MDRDEWSRSRYWLCHFLHNRHERPPVAWDGPVRLGHPSLSAAVTWLRHCAGAQTAGRPWLIGRAVTKYRHDPAFVQSLRLFVGEHKYHRQIIGRVLERLGAADQPVRRPGLFLRGGWLLGVRYELSALLLAALIDVAVFRVVRDVTDDDSLRGVCAGVIRDKRAHVAFLAERLTMEFADFNFVRRNLRRLRLRAMFSLKLARVAAEHGRLITLAGWTRRRFVGGCWTRFAGVLEQMVPYRREALLAALLAQRKDPYAKPHLIDS